MTAVVAGNDQMALGAVRALTVAGLRVPRDVSVVGVDDIPEAAFLQPPLTTLHLNFAAQGRAAVLQLLARVDGSPGPEPGSSPGHLVVRESSAPART